MATTMKAAVHLGPNYTKNMELCKNANFEEIQNLFNVTQRLSMDHPAEILKVLTIDWTSLSCQRSTLMHDQVITWTKAKCMSTQIPSYVWERCQNIRKRSENEKINFKNFDSPILMQNYLELTESRLTSSGIFPQGLPHWKCSRKSRKICEVEVLNQKDSEIESF